MNPNIKIHDYSDADRGAVETFITQLQNYERTLDPNKKPGNEVAKDYLNYLIKQCKENNGRIFVAKIGETVTGYSCVWIEDENDPTSYQRKIGYFSDLYVSPEHRRMGIGTELIKARREHVKSQGVSTVRVCTLAKNLPIQETLKAQGFTPYEVTWEAQA